MKKSVFITGGSRGIGAGIVRKFASEGWMVAFTYCENKEAADNLVRELSEGTVGKSDGQSESSIIAFQLDLERDDAYDELVRIEQEARTYFGIQSFDAVVANAGIALYGTLLDTSPEEVRDIIKINLEGAIYTTKAFIPRMIQERRGSVILMSSIWGIKGSSCETIYSATKSGLIGFGTGLTHEIGPSGIRINMIAPGVIDTDMNKRCSKEELKALTEITAMRRLGQPEDVAEMAYFLASDKASFISGQVVRVDGGIII